MNDDGTLRDQLSWRRQVGDLSRATGVPLTRRTGCLARAENNFNQKFNIARRCTFTNELTVINRNGTFASTLLADTIFKGRRTDLQPCK